MIESSDFRVLTVTLSALPTVFGTNEGTANLMGFSERGEGAAMTAAFSWTGARAWFFARLAMGDDFVIRGLNECASEKFFSIF